VARSADPTGSSQPRSGTRGRLLEGDGLARRVLQLVGPQFADQVLHVGRQRHIVELIGHLVAVDIGPFEEFQGVARAGRLVLHLVHQDVGGIGQGPRVLASLVGSDLIEGLGPVGAGSCGLEGIVVRGDEVPVLVLHQREGHLVLLHVGVLDIADGVRQALHERCDALVALAAGTRGPVHGGAFTDLALPLGAHLGQVVGEDEGRSGTVRAPHRRDRGVGKRHAGVQGYEEKKLTGQTTQIS
jgi:hypothetical protein